MAISFDLLTGLTIASILAILVIYVIVVYKKGWLKKESKADQAYYLCPNQNCKRVFQKPVWLTDLSKTPPESFQACPHCGLNIQTIASPSSLAGTVSDTATKPLLSPSESRGRQDRPHLIRKATATDVGESSLEPRRQDPQTSAPNIPLKSEGSRLPKSICRFPQNRKDAPPPEKSPEHPKKSVEKGSSESLKKCSHFFGYVRTLPKNTPIPDECLWCPSIVDCLTREAKVEAQV